MRRGEGRESKGIKMGRNAEDGNKREEKPGKNCTEDGKVGNDIYVQHCYYLGISGNFLQNLNYFLSRDILNKNKPEHRQ